MTAVNLRIAPTVRNALDRGGAVVALESTVLTHGLPRPRNLDLAHELEGIVAAAGAVPATVGLIGGELVLGLDETELERLAAGKAAKASSWNLAALAARGADAGTTVATTLHAADAAGVRVFATGGIGGVHEGSAFDESADLLALSRHTVLTVCSGPKSILDAPATLERLESLGVPVVGFRSDRLAGFHVPETDLALPVRCDTAEGVADLFRAQRSLGLASGVLVSRPVSQGLSAEDLAVWLQQARDELTRAGLRGADATPFLLRRLAELSEGRTVEVNLRLLRENAELAARVAVALSARPQGVPA